MPKTWGRDQYICIFFYYLTQHRVESVLLIQSDSPCLIGLFNLFTVDAITDITGFTSAILLLFSIFHIRFVPLFFLYCFCIEYFLMQLFNFFTEYI